MCTLKTIIVHIKFRATNENTHGKSVFCLSISSTRCFPSSCFPIVVSMCVCVYTYRILIHIILICMMMMWYYGIKNYLLQEIEMLSFPPFVHTISSCSSCNFFLKIDMYSTSSNSSSNHTFFIVGIDAASSIKCLFVYMVHTNRLHKLCSKYENTHSLIPIT